eukprot:11585409-Ditylum_brightwellii.AAC.1
MNTVALLKACSKALGIGPHAAMQTAERTLRQQAGDNRWGSYVRDLLSEGHNKSKGGVDMGDHPPITPCRAAGPHELSGDMGRIYDLVVRHFIASVSHDAVWRSTRVKLELDTLGDQGKFTISGKKGHMFLLMFYVLPFFARAHVVVVIS